MSGFPGIHKGRVAVVTGAASGLGRAFAQRLAADGAQVVVADIAPGKDTAASIEAAGGTAIAVECDVSSPESVANLEAAVSKWRGQCDILVNHAGIVPHVQWDEVDFSLWRRVCSVNLDSMFLTCKAFAPMMIREGFGRIINISSNTFLQGIPGFTPYMASKGGVIGLTRGLASELGQYGVTVNSVLPGLTMVPRVQEELRGSPVPERVVAMQAIKRLGVASDIEGTISFLASEDAGWITGQSIVVDGGDSRL